MFWFDIYISIAVLAFIDNVYVIVLRAWLIHVVTEVNLYRINSLLQSSLSLSRFLAPLISGIIWIFVKIDVFILVNSASFLFSAIFIMRIASAESIFKEDSSVETLKVTNSFYRQFKDFKQGFSYILNNKIVFELLHNGMWLNLFFHMGYTISLPYILIAQFNLSIIQFGVVQGASFLGALIATLGITIKMYEDKGRVMFMCSHMVASIMILIAMASYFHESLMNFKEYILEMFSLLSVCEGFFITVLSVNYYYFLQIKPEKEYLGRVFGVVEFISGASISLAFIVGGLMLDYISVCVIPCIGGAFLCVASVYFQRIIGKCL